MRPNGAENLQHFRNSFRLVADQELLGKLTDGSGGRCLSVWDNGRDPEDRPY
jgi:hypothetical protein